MRFALAIIICLWIGGAAAAEESGGWILAGHDALDRRDLALATDAMDALDRLGDDGGDAMLFRARYQLYVGDHSAAREAIDAVPPTVPDGGLRSTIEAGHRWMGDPREVRSPHFLLRHAPGVDELWAELALDVLEAAHDHVGQDLGWFPDEPVLVEVYPTSAAFAAATGLPPEAVANDTVGLYRWNRLLVTSPMAAAFGYPWADTLCHEYTHLVVDQRGGIQVPVWLHEGIASFEQRRWRGLDEGALPATRRALLATAVEADELVTFEEIGNCLACLQTPERVQLAFVQVHTLVDHLVRARGIEALRQALDSCRHGADAEHALATAWGGSFEEYVASWRATIDDPAGDDLAAAGVVGLGLDAARDADAPVDDDVLAGQPRGAAHARLGDLLAAREQPRAALLEYGRAGRHLEQVSPSLACKRAAVLFDLGLAGKALEEMRFARELYPDFEPLLVNSARAQIQLGRDDDALSTLAEAELINPFDPRIHAWRLDLLQEGTAAHDAAGAALSALTDHMFYDGTEPGMAR